MRRMFLVVWCVVGVVVTHAADHGEKCEPTKGQVFWETGFIQIGIAIGVGIDWNVQLSSFLGRASARPLPLPLQRSARLAKDVGVKEGGRESGARASPPATACLVLSGFIRRFTQISQIFCSARRMGGTGVCSSGRRFTPPPLNAERPTPDSERRSEKTPNSLPIN